MTAKNYLFLSEYYSETRTAQVFRCLDSAQYMVIGYVKNQEILKDYFSTEYLAEDRAEDFCQG